MAHQAAVNRLYYGDNLEVLQEHIASESVDLVYLDPPFNPNQAYNLIFGQHEITDNTAQIQAFDDTWRWTPITEEQYRNYASGALPPRVADALRAFRILLGENDAMAYLVNMAPRLVELHRVLRPAGSLYLHCDPTMSHYLKVLLDAIFSASLFRNEIIWRRTSGHSDATGYGRVHDVLLFYIKTTSATRNRVYQSYDEQYIKKYYRYREEGTNRRFMSGDLSAAGLVGGGYTYEWNGVTREWRCPIETMQRYDEENRIFYTRNGVARYKHYLDEAKGVPAQDIWLDIQALRSWHREKLGYPTQKPVRLLERIINASSNSGDVVLDPFCGCGTAVEAAERLNRRWIGIDITYIAIDVIDKRLRRTFGDSVSDKYEILGIPRDLTAARALFDRSPFDFERWAVSVIGAEPNEKQVADKGKDGSARFFTDDQGGIGQLIVSVKGGRRVTPAFVQELSGAVTRHDAQMGILVMMSTPSRGVVDEANHGGTYTWPVNNTVFPRLQVVTVEALLRGDRPRTPPLLRPYAKQRSTRGR
jgi:DNA modification methylase